MERKKLVLVFSSEDFDNPKEMMRTIGRAIQVLHSSDFKNDIQGLPPFDNSLIIKINQVV